MLNSWLEAKCNFNLTVFNAPWPHRDPSTWFSSQKQATTAGPPTNETRILNTISAQEAFDIPELHELEQFKCQRNPGYHGDLRTSRSVAHRTMALLTSVTFLNMVSVSREQQAFPRKAAFFTDASVAAEEKYVSCSI
jgi:hypothetical protein